jgi:formylglycine-generating enzyme required for sulfatase activity
LQTGQFTELELPIPGAVEGLQAADAVRQMKGPTELALTSLGAANRESTSRGLAVASTAPSKYGRAAIALAALGGALVATGITWWVLRGAQRKESDLRRSELTSPPSPAPPPQPQAQSSDGAIVSIPAGDFLTGSNDGDSDEKPMHRVHVDGVDAV